MFRSPQEVRRAVEGSFGRGHALVVGDLMLDVDLVGEVWRMSPEAAVPVVRVTGRGEAAGGAANVAMNLASLGLRVAVAGLIGDDDAGRRLRRLLEGGGVEPALIAASDGRPTVTKTRVVGGRRPLLRIDEEASAPAPEGDIDLLAAAVAARIGEGIAAVILSDYDKGALAGRLCRAAIGAARRRGVPVLVDPKGRDFRKYAGATALTPNRHEFETVAGPGDLAAPSARAAARRLREELALDFLAVTRGEEGVSVFDARGDRDFPASAREASDVTGAGDTFIAALAAGLSAGLGVDDAVTLANAAAGVVVGECGTTPICRDALLAALSAAFSGDRPGDDVRLDPP